MRSVIISFAWALCESTVGEDNKMLWALDVSGFLSGQPEPRVFETDNRYIRRIYPSGVRPHFKKLVPTSDSDPKPYTYGGRGGENSIPSAVTATGHYPFRSQSTFFRPIPVQQVVS